MANVVKQKFKIEDMHCTACAMVIDGDLEDLGVKESKTNYVKSETEVEFDTSELSEKEIIEQIKKSGYKAYSKDNSDSK